MVRPQIRDRPPATGVPPAARIADDGAPPEPGRALLVPLVLLVATDVLLLALNVLHLATPYFADERYGVTVDRGFAEVVQYVKLYWIALGFAWLGLRAREGAYAAWVAVFGYLLLDDAFSLHEKAGETLAAGLAIQPALGFVPQDFGQLLAFGLVGAGSLLVVGAAHRGGSATFRRLSRRTLALLALLALFGVGLDAAHSLARNAPRPLELTLGLLEDGGEMVVLSVLCALVVARLGAPRPARPGAPGP